MTTTRRVLLLNASYEALRTISTPRAVRLVLKGAVDVVEVDGDRVLRTSSMAYAAPSVVRLRSYVDDHGYRRRSACQRRRIIARDGHRCGYCNKKGTDFELTVDHIVPESRGGQYVPENLVAACFSCNQRKGSRTPDEARMPLLRNPSAMSYGIDMQILRHEGRGRPEWHVYLFIVPAAQRTA